jgi:hypothetical protein
MPAGENATGLPEMTESSSRAGRCGGNQTRSPNFYLELLSWQGIPARAPIVLQEAHLVKKLEAGLTLPIVQIALLAVIAFLLWR